MQNGRAGRLHPAVGTARRHLAAALEKLARGMDQLSTALGDVTCPTQGGVLVFRV